ncbi:MAG: outer membrane beta-barrel protein [Candidatus Glassbacteria bacterium]|nr:outer membrane beta-barrel protein [Candidatus Glassbacteria bacterium]
MRGLLILVLAVLLIPSPASARLEAGLGLSLGWPSGDFQDEVDFAWGGGGRVGWSFGEVSPAKATVFLDVNYLNYGRERRVEPFSYTIPDVFVDVITDNYLIHFSPGISVGLRNGPFRPYAEVYGGLTYIATKTKIENRSLPSVPIAESTNFNDYTYNFGFGGGLKIRLWQSKDSVPAVDLREALLDIKLSYVKGGEAEYLKKGSIERLENATIRYGTVRTATDIVQARIGVYLTF